MFDTQLPMLQKRNKNDLITQLPSLVIVFPLNRVSFFGLGLKRGINFRFSGLRTFVANTPKINRSTPPHPWVFSPPYILKKVDDGIDLHVSVQDWFNVIVVLGVCTEASMFVLLSQHIQFHFNLFSFLFQLKLKIEFLSD